MAEGKITITILGEGGGTKSSGSSSGGEKEKSPAQIAMDTLRKVMHPIQTGESALQDGLRSLMGDSGEAVAAVGVGSKVLSDAVSTAYSVAMMEHNRYFSLREDYISQNKMNMFQTQMSTAKSILTSFSSGVLTGAAAGAAGGIGGVVVGAAVGGVSSLINTGVRLEAQKKQKIEQYNMQLNAINAQTEFMSSRASLINGGRGTEN